MVCKILLTTLKERLRMADFFFLGEFNFTDSQTLSKKDQNLIIILSEIS